MIVASNSSIFFLVSARLYDRFPCYFYRQWTETVDLYDHGHFLVARGVITGKHGRPPTFTLVFEK